MLYAVLFSYGECKVSSFKDILMSARLPNTCSLILSVVKGPLSEAEKVQLLKDIIRRGERPTIEGIKMAAVGGKNPTLLKVLIREYLRANGEEAAISSLVNYAVLTGDRGLVKRLLNLGLDLNDTVRIALNHIILNASPLYLAVETGDTAMVEFLVVNGAKVNYSARKVSNPMERVLLKGDANMLRCLLRLGAIIPETDYWIYRILGGRDVGVLKVLKEYGYPMGRMAVYSAIIGDTAQMRFLLANAPDSVQKKAVKVALMNSYHWVPFFKLRYIFEVLKLSPYLDSGATALHYASYGANLKAVRYLIRDVGLDPHGRDWKGDTPLHYAARSESRRGFEGDQSPPGPGDSVAAYLIDTFNLDPNARNNRGNTPLHEAALSGNYEVVEVLVKRGADVRIRNDEGKTPYDLAKDDGIRRLLRTKGKRRR